MHSVSSASNAGDIAIMIIPGPPTRHHLRHGLANDLLPCELIYASPRRERVPRVLVFRSRTRSEFITRVDMQMPEIAKVGFRDRLITDLIQITELANSAWASSRITRTEEKPILRIGPKPKRKPAPPPLGFRTFIYSL